MIEGFAILSPRVRMAGRREQKFWIEVADDTDQRLDSGARRPAFF